MKRRLNICSGIVGVVLLSLLFSACKKHVNPAHPTPDNSRLLSYTKFITPNVGTPVNQTFRFYYDDRGRVSQIAYASNDETELTAGVAQRLATFTYVNDTIFKTTTTLQTAVVLERDTFIQNSQKQIIHAYMPNYEVHFEYYGKLIARKTEYFYSSYDVPYIKLGMITTYTSNNGDILSSVFDGSVTATFVGLAAPLSIDYAYDLTVVNHAGIGAASDASTTDQLNNYSGYGLSVTATDNNGDVLGPFSVTSPSYRREEHRVYPDLLNRPGDLYYLQSFTQFGVNIYQNEHLVKQVSGTGPTIPGVLNVQYTIDADSKISQTYVTGYGYMNNSSVVFKMQYETY